MNTAENSKEPMHSASEKDRDDNIWLRGLLMIIFAVFFSIGQTLLVITAIVQFLWMLTQKEKNEAVADFGTSLGKWMHRVALFQSGASDDKPFPWSAWESTK